MAFRRSSKQTEIQSPDDNPGNRADVPASDLQTSINGSLDIKLNVRNSRGKRAKKASQPLVRVKEEEVDVDVPGSRTAPIKVEDVTDIKPVKIKEDAWFLPSGSVDRRLQAIAATQLHIAADPELTSVEFDRAYLGRIFGGSNMRMHSTPSSTRVAEHGISYLLYPVIEWNPHCPQKIGAPGLIFTGWDDMGDETIQDIKNEEEDKKGIKTEDKKGIKTEDKKGIKTEDKKAVKVEDTKGADMDDKKNIKEEGKSDIKNEKPSRLIPMFVKPGSKTAEGSIAWHYLGHYTVHISEPLTLEEWLGQSEKARWTWARGVFESNWGAKHQAGTLWRERNPDSSDKPSRSAIAKLSDEIIAARKAGRPLISEEGVRRILDSGEWRVPVCCVKCVDYKVEFQQDLINKQTDERYQAPPKVTKPRRKKRTQQDRVRASESSSAYEDEGEDGKPRAKRRKRVAVGRINQAPKSSTSPAKRTPSLGKIKRGRKAPESSDDDYCPSN